MRLLLYVLGGAMLLWTAACKTPLQASEARGKAVYEQNCMPCHEQVHPGLKVTPPQLHGLLQHTELPDGTTAANEVNVRAIIVNGHGTMPAFDGRLTTTELSDLVAYLHRL